MSNENYEPIKIIRRERKLIQLKTTWKITVKLSINSLVSLFETGEIYFKQNT